MHTGSGALSLPPHAIPESAASETAASEAIIMFVRRLISFSFFLGAENSASRRRSTELVTSVKDAGGTSRGSRKCHATGRYDARQDTSVRVDRTKRPRFDRDPEI